MVMNVSKSNNPTSFPEVNAILQELLPSIQGILGSHFIGMYLDGSLTSGDFDEDSDIDFVVVTDEDISGDLFLALQVMHDRIAAIDSIWAIQLEGSYISQHAIRRYDPEHALHPNLERGDGERLKMADHGEAWAIHRYVLRERGITIFGPAPQTLIDPVLPDELRRAMLPALHGWATQILNKPDWIIGRGYQSYVVLTLCRILYTLQMGEVASKPNAARWAKETLGERWNALIDRAWVGRHNGQLAAEPDDINQTLDFIRYALKRIQYVKIPSIYPRLLPMEFPSQNEIFARLIAWAEQQPLVRAMLLTSSRAIPNAPVDVLSDYDVILALSDVHPFHADRAWLEAFSPVLALYRDPLEPDDGYLKSGYVVQFENNLKIDFSLWPVEILQRAAAGPVLPPELDAGYKVLLDKDHLTGGLKPPTYTAYIPKPPSETEYQEAVEVFFVEATYVAKFLWRDDVMAAKYILDNMMKQEHLRPMLEWHLETDHQWSVKPGPYGRRLKKWLRLDLWTELEGTYTGAGLDENWQALDRTIALLRRAALEVGERLGFAYPHDIDRRTVAYLQMVKDLK